MTTIPLLRDKSIVIGVTGGISAYKVADLCSRFVKAGAVVDIVMTASATKFVGPITFQALTHRPVSTEMFSLLQETEIGHVSLGKRADLMIIAPATANTMAKLAHGLSDNMVVTTALACRSPILIAPAMESAMWENPATQTNLDVLKKRGVHTVGPVEGRLASGSMGVGRMSEPQDIFDAARWLISRQRTLNGTRVVVTAGCTHEALDPVRFIGNRSSGKMGYALAYAARDRGADVVLIHGPTSLNVPHGVKDVSVNSAKQMHTAVLKNISTADALIKTAAVTDYRPATFSKHKIKKNQESMSLKLVQNPDILASVVSKRKKSDPLKVVIGFAAETESLVEYAQDKLIRKGLDLIVANDISASDSGFAVDTNRVTLIDSSGELQSLPLLTKQEVAEIVIDHLIDILESKSHASF
ncbi:MAG: bifunctional phosphopantothenoylcysteine decarboxylase/phosphopantothenate--cysteine ligase CoaBC [Desulfobacterales bacterium]|jgi:phosphopantothenoylcysteine decarboxylase/phosphopantothenate--cysteine ligase